MTVIDFLPSLGPDFVIDMISALFSCCTIIPGPCVSTDHGLSAYLHSLSIFMSFTAWLDSGMSNSSRSLSSFLLFSVLCAPCCLGLCPHEPHA